jgi:hypothetical protein
MPIPKKVRLRPNEQRHSVREVMHGLSEGGGPRGRLTCPSIGLPAGKPARGAPDAGHAACRSRFHERPILSVLESRQLRAEGSRTEKPPAGQNMPAAAKYDYSCQKRALAGSRHLPMQVLALERLASIALSEFMTGSEDDRDDH